MSWLAVQPYYKVVRRVQSTELKITEEDRELLLSHQSIITKTREFAVKDVFDISFRSMGSSGGMLYLHTSFGVYSYMVRDNPSDFMTVFKNMDSNKK
ncbi:hypothetical protein [Paenibacillus lemnae]|uniref:DUF304 domain-containing protein n=1 Tax=Paenibacillus lemnae TaxID=1330551 RepID=A0A848MBY4_PAELE|nr:hypothetical protein [Paenibacillus lemnae]NMO98215.1 hypothetical protein [Paenibacillus lemnae]